MVPRILADSDRCLCRCDAVELGLHTVLESVKSYTLDIYNSGQCFQNKSSCEAITGDQLINTHGKNMC